MPFPDFTPGQESIPADGMQRLSDVARRFTGSLGGQGNNLLDITGATVQNSPPEDNWWIRITDGPGSGSGSGSGAQAAAYGWVMVNRNGSTFSDLGYAHSGTITSNPAYEQNGNLDVPLGTIVRAWVNNDSGRPCMEFEYCCDGGPGSAGPCIQKVLVTLCYQGATLKQIFNIQKGCDVIATSCEDIPLCGSGCESGTPTDTCPCFHSNSPEYWTFSFPSYNTQAVLPSPTEWCLPRCAPDYQFIHGCCYSFADLVCNVVCALWRAGITVHPDGSATLVIDNGVADVQATWFAIYYVSTWNCNASNTLNLISHYSYNDALTFPATLTVSPAADASFCAGGGGGTTGDCASCGHPDSGSFSVAFSGVTNGTCTGCTSFSGPVSMGNIGSCQYQGFVGNITCGGFGIAISATLIDNGSTGWELSFSGIATYFCSYASWNCGGVSTMGLVSSTGQCATWPATVTVTDNG